MEDELYEISLCLIIKGGKKPHIYIEEPFRCFSKDFEFSFYQKVIEYFYFLFKYDFFHDFDGCSLDIEKNYSRPSIVFSGFDQNRMTKFVKMLKFLSENDCLYINKTKMNFKIVV